MQMVVSKTPLRISFAGGGSDIPKFYEKFGGAVLSTTIDKFVYVMVKESFDGMFHLHYSDTENCATVEEIKHPIIRETLQEMGIINGLDISTLADVPKGTGLGSSSAFTVGLINALATLQGETLSRHELAKKASHIEIVRCGEPIGEQDQIAAAFGGLNLIQFKAQGHGVVRLVFANDCFSRLQLFYTGSHRKASSVLRTELVDGDVKELAWLAVISASHFGDAGFDFGDVMFKCWQHKKKCFPLASNPDIDKWYDLAMKAGATGGKVCGAGGGGFLLFSTPLDKHQAVESALSPLRRLPFKFWDKGSEIL